MSYNEHTYYVILRKKSKGYEILYNIGSENSITTVLRLNGKNADNIFKNIIEDLAKQGATIPLKISDYEHVYSIREDLGPIVGAYLILIRRAKNIEKWSKFFKALIEGQYVGIAKTFAIFLEVALELSRSIPTRSHKSYTLSPTVVDALSTALKRFVDKVAKSMKIE